MKNQIFSYYKTNFNSTMHNYNYIVFPFLDEWDEFNFEWSTQWSFADGLGFNPKADPEKIGLAILILRQVARSSLMQERWMPFILKI